MTKRRPGFVPRPRDNWPTPAKALAPLLPWLASGTSFIEPCAGAGQLADLLEQAGHCCRARHNLPVDARSHSYGIEDSTIFITNPPWSRQLGMDEMLVNLSNQAPTWLLIPTDWLFTSRALPYLPRLRAIVSIGRVKWVENSPTAGFDNACWCRFGQPSQDDRIHFTGRRPVVRQRIPDKTLAPAN